MNSKDHAKALAKLRSLKPNDRVEVEAVDHHSIKAIMTEKEAVEMTLSEPLTAKTIGYYRKHSPLYLWLSADKIEDEEDRGQWNVVLTKYLVRVVRLKEA